MVPVGNDGNDRLDRISFRIALRKNTFLPLAVFK
jgi:hypothetical protein